MQKTPGGDPSWTPDLDKRPFPIGDAIRGVAVVAILVAMAFLVYDLLT